MDEEDDPFATSDYGPDGNGFQLEEDGHWTADGDWVPDDEPSLIGGLLADAVGAATEVATEGIGAGQELAHHAIDEIPNTVAKGIASTILTGALATGGLWVLFKVLK